jgi:hypothetical protein
MPGQANRLANVTLGYEKSGFSIRVSMAYQGDALQTVGASPELDGYSKAFLRWDVAFQYRFSKSLSVVSNLSNLSSLPEGSYLGTADSPTREEYFGWTADFGVRFEF